MENIEHKPAGTKRAVLSLAKSTAEAPVLPEPSGDGRQDSGEGAGTSGEPGADEAAAAAALVAEQAEFEKLLAEEAEAKRIADEAAAAAVPAVEPTIYLDAPEGELWENYEAVLNSTQRTLVLGYGNLRIAHAAVTSPTAPETHETGHGEVIISKGDKFSALLTNGETITPLFV